MEPTTTEILLDLLKRAAAAHGLHEKEAGKPDPIGLRGTPST